MSIVRCCDTPPMPFIITTVVIIITVASKTNVVSGFLMHGADAEYTSFYILISITKA